MRIVCPALIAVEAAAGFAPDPMVRVMAMIARRPREAETLAVNLRLSNAERARLLAWADPGLVPQLQQSAGDVKRAAYWFGAQAVRDRMTLEAADHGDGAALKRSVAALEDWTVPRLPVGGDDALAAGLTGPAIGEALRDVEARWIESDFSLSRKSLLEALKARAQTPR